MKNRKLGKNRGVWCGTVISPLEFSHEITNRDTGDIIEKFYNVVIEVDMKDMRGRLLGKSELPVTLSEKKLVEIRPDVERNEDKLKVGDIVFIKGSWRTYDHKSGGERTRLDQNAFVKIIELHEEYPTRTRNKFEFEGVLVKKLYKIERDEKGYPLKDEFGQLVPSLNEEGGKKYTVRKNKESKIVNDFIVAVNRPNNSDYVPCLAYEGLAKQIANEVEIGSEVKGTGYIRTRTYMDRNGEERKAYEAVVEELEVIVPEEEEVQDQPNASEENEVSNKE